MPNIAHQTFARESKLLISNHADVRASFLLTNLGMALPHTQWMQQQFQGELEQQQQQQQRCIKPPSNMR